jgi:hypothetical protein
MSAIPPKADIAERGWHVRLVPKADIVEHRGNVLAEVDVRTALDTGGASSPGWNRRHYAASSVCYFRTCIVLYGSGGPQLSAHDSE